MLNLDKLLSIGLLLSVTALFSSTTAAAEMVEYEGLIKPSAIIEVGAPVEGIVARINVDRSSTVTQGQILIELESSVEQADLQLAQTRATINAEIGLQQTLLEFATRIHNRVKVLDVISNNEKDQAASDAAMARFRLQRAEENNALAKLEYKKAKAILDRRSIKSPVSGVVVERYVSPGEYVNNQPLLQIAKIDQLEVEVIIPAQRFGQILPGMTAIIVPELLNYTEQTATITLIDKVIDPASNTFSVRLELPNSQQQLPSGLKCLVRIKIDPHSDMAKTPVPEPSPDKHSADQV
jgi:RND family efflux transporter MFP subunit